MKNLDMDMCDDQVSQMELPVTDSNKVDDSYKHRDMSSQTIANEQTRLGLLQPEELNIDNLLSVFEGNRDSVEYFIGLWNDMKCLSGHELKSINCDPRDEKKREQIGDWKPSVRLCFPDVTEFSELDNGDVSVPEISLATKQTVLDKSTEDIENETVTGRLSGDGDRKKFPCGVHGCGQVLESLAHYEAHYHHCHNYVCDSCRRAFVSDFLLDIHLQENHDSYFAILSPRVDMYRCLVESCAEKFRTPELRKDHLVSIHKYPSSFSFHHPVKDSRSKLSSKPTSSKSIPDTNHQHPSSDMSMDVQCTNHQHPSSDMSMDVQCLPDATTSKPHTRIQDSPSQRKRVPTSVCFGRGSQRAFQPRGGRGRRGRGGKWYQTDAAMETNTAVDIETVDMNDLAQALT